MSRAICWICSKQLMYQAGKPIFTVIVDPIGAEHMVHKACARNERFERAVESLKDFNQRHGGDPCAS